METNIVVDPNDFGLQEQQAKDIESVFLPVQIERENLKTTYKDIISKEQSESLCKDAKALRLKLVKVRSATNTIHKNAKAYYLAGGRFVDAWKNKNNAVVEEMEERLRDIEEYYIRIEKKRIADLQIKREIEVKQYNVETEFINLGEMSAEVYANYLSGVKKHYDDQIALERQAEKERIENEKRDQIERERIKKENQKLQKALDNQRKKLEEQQRKEQEAVEAQRKLKKELQQKEEAEAKKKADALHKQNELMAANDRVKIDAFLKQISAVVLVQLEDRQKEKNITMIIESTIEQIKRYL